MIFSTCAIRRIVWSESPNCDFWGVQNHLLWQLSASFDGLHSSEWVFSSFSVNVPWAPIFTDAIPTLILLCTIGYPCLFSGPQTMWKCLKTGLASGILERCSRFCFSVAYDKARRKTPHVRVDFFYLFWHQRNLVLWKLKLRLSRHELRYACKLHCRGYCSVNLSKSQCQPLTGSYSPSGHSRLWARLIALLDSRIHFFKHGRTNNSFSTYLTS